jgi:multimeric flavodoxin WrbA
MKIALINGSPKSKDSSSGFILDALQKRLSVSTVSIVVSNVTKQKQKEIPEAIQGCNALVFAFPLYVDGLPAHFLEFLDEAKYAIALNAPDAKVYCLVNNGFYEARQNSIAIAMMKSFCKHSGIAWGYGVGIGGGGMIHVASAGHGPMKNLGRVLDRLADNIYGLKTVDDCFVEPNFPRSLYMFAANRGWKTQGKKNGLKIKQLYKNDNE